MTDPVNITVDVVSDVCCPWCYLGKRRLDKAIALLPDLNVTVHWRPFQLDPTIPPGGVDRTQYMLNKFKDPARIAANHDRLAAMGAADGIAYDFDAIKISPNSLNAHRVLRWAGDEGKQGAVKERLLELFWALGADIGDPKVLASAAADCGMDGALVAVRLASDEDVSEVEAEIDQFQRIGVNGVPTFILERKYAVSGAQEVATLVEALREVAEEKAFGPKV